MLKTMRYLKSLGSSMIRRPRKVHAEIPVESFEPVAVTFVQPAGEDGDVSEPSIIESPFCAAADECSDDECESVLSDDTVHGRRYRTVRFYEVSDPSSIPEGSASVRTSATDPPTSTVLDVLADDRAPGVRWFRVSHLDTQAFSLSSLSTRCVEESAEATDDEDWKQNSHESDETK
eukprot:TRINITY_DN10181_c1_g1_i1.p1 TRINITY_DN10181_c1_g1~~TRINITY_DN10181_c1_g1_i1.p1  ORF type:complete len:206 (+),score=20.73 TRINITY_DN10181_c1_g1_i1:92-619(+)